jgi:hypothetical protein
MEDIWMINARNKNQNDLPGLDIKEKGTSKKTKDKLIYEKHQSFNALR